MLWEALTFSAIGTDAFNTIPSTPIVIEAQIDAGTEEITEI